MSAILILLHLPCQTATEIDLYFLTFASHRGVVCDLQTTRL